MDCERWQLNMSLEYIKRVKCSLKSVVLLFDRLRQSDIFKRGTRH